MTSAPISKHYGIVAAVDGSPASRVAVDWAARDAALRHVPLTIVHVQQADEISVWLDIVESQDYLAERDRNAGQIVDDAAAVAAVAQAGGRGTPVETLVLKGPKMTDLIDMSKDADMMVVGRRGVSNWLGALLGSTSSELAHHAHCPVAIIHDEDPLMGDVSKAPVAVGIDGSPASELATAIAFDEASRRGVDLVAIHTWINSADFSIRVLPDNMAVEADEELAQRLAGWCERYPDVTVRRVLGQDSPAHRLLEESERAQLLVVGSRGLGGFTGLMLGSVSWAVAQAARMPVIIARQS